MSGHNALLVGVMLAVLGCDPDSSSPHVSVTDSAGVRIVENASAKWTDRTTWRLQNRPALVIEVNDAELESGPLDPASVFRTARGEIVVGDGRSFGWNRLLVYDSQGRFRRHISRKGEGPCEFGQLWWAAPYRSDSVAAFDMARDAVVVLGMEGECARSVPTPQGTYTREQARSGLYTGGAEAVYPDGSFLAYPVGFVDVPTDGSAAWFVHTLLRTNPVGEVLDTLGRFRIGEVGWDGMRHRMLPYARWSFRTLDGFDLVTADGSSFEYARYDSTGTLLELVRRPYERVAINQEDKVAFVKALDALSSQETRREPSSSTEARIGEFEWPDVKPAISALLVDDLGHIWIEEYRHFFPDAVPDDPGPTLWSVFADDGEWLGRVSVPGRLIMQRVYDDMVFGIWRDADGVSSVRGFELIKPGS